MKIIRIVKITKIICLIVFFCSHFTWGVLELEEKDIIRVVDKGETDKLKTWLNQGLFPFTHKAFETKNKAKGWTDNGVFRKTGVRTEKEERYTNAQTKVSKYGYRLGTKEEAERLGFQ